MAEGPIPTRPGLHNHISRIPQGHQSRGDIDKVFGIDALGREPINLQGVRLARVRYAPMFGAFRHVFASRHRSTVSEMTRSDCSAPSNTPFSKSSSMRPI
jgi:hypothetical protein